VLFELGPKKDKLTDDENEEMSIERPVKRRGMGRQGIS